MKISDLENVTLKNLNGLSDQELRGIIKNVGGSLNKRYTNIKSNPMTNKSAVHGLDKTGGKFSSRGKSHEQLVGEVLRMKNFAGRKTSTVKGAIESNKAIIERVKGKSAQEIGAEKAKAYRENEKAKIKAKGQKKLTKAQKKRIKKESEKIKKREAEKVLQEVGKEYEKFSDNLNSEIEGLLSVDPFMKGQNEYYAKMQAKSEKSESIIPENEDWSSAFI